MKCSIHFHNVVKDLKYPMQVVIGDHKSLSIYWLHFCCHAIKSQKPCCYIIAMINFLDKSKDGSKLIF
jgi:hypothetical protein